MSSAGPRLGALVLVVVVGLAVTACSSNDDSSGAGTPSSTSTKRSNPDAVSMRKLAGDGLLVGAAVPLDALQQDKEYRRTLAREYDEITPENAMKWDTIHPRRGHYDFGPADTIVRFARQHDMAVRGHTLVWYRQVPEWVTSQAWTREELERVLHDHIRRVVRHFRGKVVAWDVVNEAIDENGQMRDSVWSRVIGPEYIDLAFTWAHEADANATLFYNEFDIERAGPKADAVEALVRGLKARGIPIKGVGIQGHELTVRAPTRETMDRALHRYAALGLDVGITELDVGISVPSSDKELEEQARIYDDVLAACLAEPRCTTFVTWGFTDRYSWIPDELPGFGDALPFDRDYRPKPAAKAIRARLTMSRR